jgi:glycosyltransferase involved in cell wall biosynthesis
MVTGIMRLYILFHRSFSPRYRVPQFVSYFGERGIDTDLVRLSRDPVTRWRQFRRARRYEVTVLQRRLLQPWDMAFLRHAARCLIFDFDDALMYRSSKRSRPFSVSRMIKFKKTVVSCDMVFAGNRFLKQETERYVSPNKVHVIPTVVDMERYSPKSYTETQKAVTIGWIGSRGTLPYLETVMPALDDVARRWPHVQLKIVCDSFPERHHIPVVQKKWEESAEVEDVQSFDVGIMPLSDDVWSRGKCALKIIQYQAVGIPVVCSPVGANRDIVKHGSNGLWARSHDEWVECLSMLIESARLREKMGAAGRRLIAERYSVQAVGERIVRLMRGVVEGGGTVQ